MKRRFIFAISFFFLLATGSVSFLQFHYFEQERMSLIDGQIDRSVSSILSTDLSVANFSNKEEVEDLIFEALEDEPLNQFIFLRNRAGKLLYQNSLAENLSVEVPIDPGKHSLESGGHLLRYATYLLPNSGQILQVGLVLDQRQIYWSAIKGKIIAFSIGLTLILISLAAFLTNYLLRPLSELALYFEFQASNPEQGKPSPPLPAFARSSPEFFALAKSVQRATERWQNLLAHHGSLLARLAHEIRTPLTIANNKLESLKAKSPSPLLEEAREELAHAENITREFMTWSKLEYSAGADPELHAISLAAFCEKLSCIKNGPANLVVENLSSAGEKVFAKPEHLRLILENLLQNAVRYGSPSQPITLTLREDGFSVASHGEEIPSSVRENFGKPFNRGSERPDSIGIGLANVVSVCKRYGWKFSLQRKSDINKNTFLVTYS